MRIHYKSYACVRVSYACIYMYVCICLCIELCTWMYINKYICIYIYIYICFKILYAKSNAGTQLKRQEVRCPGTKTYISIPIIIYVHILYTHQEAKGQTPQH